MNDDEIIELYWNRNEHAIEETSNKYDKYLMKISNNIISNIEDNKECVNDTYLKAWNSIPPYRPKALLVFLSKITRQLSIDMYRKKSAAKRIKSDYQVSLTELEDIIPDSKEVHTEIETRLLKESINNFLKSLNKDERDVFIARYFYFYPIKKIATYCDMSESKVKSVLFRTRKKLKDYLNKEGYDI